MAFQRTQAMTDIAFVPLQRVHGFPIVIAKFWGLRNVDT